MKNKESKARDKQYRLRMNEEEMGILNDLSEKTGLSKSDILRKGLEMQRKLLKYSQ